MAHRKSPTRQAVYKKGNPVYDSSSDLINDVLEAGLRYNSEVDSMTLTVMPSVHNADYVEFNVEGRIKHHGAFLDFIREYAKLENEMFFSIAPQSDAGTVYNSVVLWVAKKVKKPKPAGINYQAWLNVILLLIVLVCGYYGYYAGS
jgi:hypothetical protein